VRTQSFAYPLFAAFLLLLLDDARAPGRRVLLALPLLVLWANIHGSVVLGAALTALYGLLLIRRHLPSSLRTRGYSQSTLFNSEFKA
jgi:hypothetical protein